MNAKQNQKILELHNAHKNLMLWFKEIKRLMPEVEAIISQMGGVGAAPRNEKFKRESDLELKAKEIFHKNLKR